MRQRLFLLLGLTCVGVGIVMVLFATTPREPRMKNGFSRTILKANIQPATVLDLGFNSFYFSGYDNGNIILGNYTAPLFVVTSSADLVDTTQHYITNISKEVGRHCILLGHSGTFFLYDRITRHVFSGNMNDFRVSSTDSIKAPTDLIYPISNGNYLLRAFSPPPFRYFLGKQTNGIFLQDTTLIDNGPNALFTSDGLFASNEDRSLYVYNYFYRNRFITLDSNLHMLKVGKTIDTNLTAKVHLSSLKGGKVLTVTGRPKPINVTTCLYKSLLFVYSSLIADNQSAFQRPKCNDIDIYEAKSATYMGSICLERYKETSVTNMRVFNNQLYVISGHYLMRYPLTSLGI